MTDFELFADALAKTETNNREGLWGDPKDPNGMTRVGGPDASIDTRGRNFMACGRWQIHPAWYHDWVPLKVPVEASWDEMFREALENFYNNCVGTGDGKLAIAMKFHLGVAAVRAGKFDQAYANRFVRFLMP